MCDTDAFLFRCFSFSFPFLVDVCSRDAGYRQVECKQNRIFSLAGVRDGNSKKHRVLVFLDIFEKLACFKSTAVLLICPFMFLFFSWHKLANLYYSFVVNVCSHGHPIDRMRASFDLST